MRAACSRPAAAVPHRTQSRWGWRVGRLALPSDFLSQHHGRSLPVSVLISVHQPAPDRTSGAWPDSASDLGCKNSTEHPPDDDHKPTDVAVGIPLGEAVGRLSQCLVEMPWVSVHTITASARSTGWMAGVSLHLG